MAREHAGRQTALPFMRRARIAKADAPAVPTLVVVRHGATTFNADNPDHGGERLRGWLDVPLDSIGRNQAKAAAHVLRKYKIARVVSSDLRRASDTGAAVASKHAGVPVTVTSKLRPWDMGELNGKSVDSVVPVMLAHIQDDQKPVPGGSESFRQFQRRALGCFKSLMEEAKGAPERGAIVCATHSRNTRILRGWLTAGARDVEKIDRTPLMNREDVVPPGGIMVLKFEGGRWVEVGRSAEGADGLTKYHFAGLPIVVENPAGSERKWIAEDGSSGVVKMQHDYGYIDGYTAADGEGLDCYVGPDESAPDVHVVHQLKAPGYKAYDEDKTMIGFPDATAAKAAYLAHRDDGDRAFGGMSTIPMKRFRHKLRRRAPDVKTKIRASAPSDPAFDGKPSPGGLCLDFDGVICASGQPIPGAIDAIRNYVDHYGIVFVHSARSSGDDGAHEWMVQWLSKNVPADLLAKLVVSVPKPIASVYLDDRGLRFDGKDYPTVDQLDALKPWWQVEKGIPDETRLNPRSTERNDPDQYRNEPPAPLEGGLEDLSGNAVDAGTVVQRSKPDSATSGSGAVAMTGYVPPDLNNPHEGGLGKEAVAKPFAGFSDFASCVATQQKHGASEESARNICGALQRDHERKQAAKKSIVWKSLPWHDSAGDERYALGVVLEPEPFDGEGDLQGDTYSADEIRGAAHDFMVRYRADPSILRMGKVTEMGLNHAEAVTGKIVLLESYLMPTDTVVGGQAIKAGSWLMAVRYVDDDLWQKVKSGQLTGFSIGGDAIRKRRAAA